MSNDFVTVNVSLAGPGINAPTFDDHTFLEPWEIDLIALTLKVAQRAALRVRLRHRNSPASHEPSPHRPVPLIARPGAKGKP